jgi:hypothetical protein
MRELKIAAFVSLAGLATAAATVEKVVPIGYENQQGTAGFLGPLASTARSYQLLIHEDQLSDLVGKEFTGLAWRSTTSATTTWPPVAVTYDNYDIYLGLSVPPEQRSVTLAENVAGPQTQVRSGSLFVAADSYGFGTPAAFGPTIEFTQPYLYTGGHLLVELRHTGMTGATSRSVDAISTTTPGYFSQFAAAWGSGYTSTGGSAGNFSIVRFSATGGGCYANCDGSTTEPILNVADFTCFLSKFAAGDPYANCDGSTTEPILNVADFTCFLSKFAAGC